MTKPLCPNYNSKEIEVDIIFDDGVMICKKTDLKEFRE